MIRPHGITPPKSPPLVLFLCRLKKGPSIGLGVGAGLGVRALRRAGISADVAFIGPDLRIPPSVRLVVLEGNCVDLAGMRRLAAANPKARFVWRCHSQVAFLQIEPTTIELMRGLPPNVRLAGNSRRFTDWAAEAWGREVMYLPNLYDLATSVASRLKGTNGSDLSTTQNGGDLRIASFGAMRLQKHHTVAAAAAVIVARRLGQPVELYLNRDETSGAGSIHQAIEALTRDTPVKVVGVPWQPAPRFRQTIAAIDLCFQLSSSETFNYVTADAASAGVPSVVGESLDWPPADWRAPIDDPIAAAEVALRLLRDETAGERGRAALDHHCGEALREWLAVVQS